MKLVRFFVSSADLKGSRKSEKLRGWLKQVKRPSRSTTRKVLRNFFGQERHRPRKSEGARTPMSTVTSTIIYTQENFKVTYAYKKVQISDGLFDGLFDRQKTMDFKRYLLLLLHHFAIDRANNRSFLISSQLNRSEVPTFFPRVGHSKVKFPTFPPPQRQKFVAKSP